MVASRTPIRLGDVTSCPSPQRWLHVVGDNLPVAIGAAYIPNAERSPTEKRIYWEWLLDAGPGLAANPTVVCGDLNTALPYVDEDGSTIQCAKQLARMIDSGWTDLWRRHHAQARASSWWSSNGNGFRLDHALGTPSVAAMCSGADYATVVGDRCVAHPGRVHEGCDQKPLSDHSMLIVDLEPVLPAGR